MSNRCYRSSWFWNYLGVSIKHQVPVSNVRLMSQCPVTAHPDSETRRVYKTPSSSIWCHADEAMSGSESNCTTHRTTYYHSYSKQSQCYSISPRAPWISFPSFCGSSDPWPIGQALYEKVQRKRKNEGNERQHLYHLGVQEVSASQERTLIFFLFRLGGEIAMSRLYSEQAQNAEKMRMSILPRWRITVESKKRHYRWMAIRTLFLYATSSLKCLSHIWTLGSGHLKPIFVNKRILSGVIWDGLPSSSNFFSLRCCSIVKWAMR